MFSNFTYEDIDGYLVCNQCKDDTISNPRCVTFGGTFDRKQFDFKKLQNPIDIMFIGQNPWFNKDKYDKNIYERAFGDKSEKILIEYISELQFDTSRIWITNVVQCITSSNALIYTSKGLKKIKNIKEGDKVLTHNGRFKKVLKVWNLSQGAETSYIKIQCFKDKYSERYKENRTINLSLTKEHPILTSSGWKPVKDLTLNDEIACIAIKCECCKKLFVNANFDINKRYFCSLKCRNKIIMKEMYEKNKNLCYEITKNANKKINEQIKQGKFHFRKGKFVGKEHWMHKLTGDKLKLYKKKWSKHGKKNCGKFVQAGVKALRKYRSKYGNFWKPKNNKFFIPAKNTKIEVIMKNALINENIKFKDNIRIGFYWPDIVLKDYKIVIECNGRYWHKSKKIEMKSKRTKFIESKGFKVLIFEDWEILKHIDKCILEIKRNIFNDSHKYKFKFVKIKNIEVFETKRKFRRYNLSVEDDESYIVNNIVVHNCSVEENVPYLVPKAFENCKFLLNEEITNVNPKIIASLGKTATDLVTQLFSEFKLKYHHLKMLHPNALSYNSSLKEKFREQFQQLKKMIGE